ncbi:MAG: hypothetical protein COX39_01915 [Candidatus Nealsonbacteria bacterium CG23_combo_of_CG06-09_8_20_14_all_40_13]|uniref:Uncharacterized protein n=1 Tax=Candidatus Nealsonbacteria bacterium CG23_combo_of_CG06-09_8_20_14_all_40_13 TaxID=1974724 RepID=A0A2G9YR32_9BACT|nr:MAG: hypothetical protein COX39_01915 [Candidatus Nealsonbacteria bacterium CG23_combo_of_CG06-09_8_20_14_all_40_13]PIU43001.1 MAG: hypothetical protein COS97_03355 [Candidatus Nealsonbacteria bacterium CG07_land_8_20_14_0_80_40_10]
MYYLYPQIILAFTIALYLYDRYIRQEVKNLTTLGLIIGFINLALVGLIQFIISTNLLLWDYKILYFLRYLFLVSALVFIFWAVVRLVSQKLFFKTVLPILIFLTVLFWGYLGVFVLEDISLATLVGTFIFYVPIGLTLGILFLLLYSRLAFIKDGFKNNLGPFFISLGWFIHAINASRVPFVLDKPEMEKYLLWVAIPYIFWLIGFILLEKETKKVLETKLKIHGLRRKGTE